MFLVRLWSYVPDRQQVLVEHLVQCCALVHKAMPYVAIHTTYGIMYAIFLAKLALVAPGPDDDRRF